jgi:hypothetical protein
LPEKWEESIIVPVYNKGDKTDCDNYNGISFYSISSSQGKVHIWMKLLRMNIVGFDVADELLVKFSVFVGYRRRMGVQ